MNGQSGTPLMQGVTRLVLEALFGGNTIATIEKQPV